MVDNSYFNVRYQKKAPYEVLMIQAFGSLLCLPPATAVAGM